MICENCHDECRTIQPYTIQLHHRETRSVEADIELWLCEGCMDVAGDCLLAFAQLIRRETEADFPAEGDNFKTVAKWQSQLEAVERDILPDWKEEDE